VRRGAWDDEGAGVVLVLALVGLVGALGLVLGGVGLGVVARARAQAAADLAALAAGDVLAVQAALAGGAAPQPGVACRRAGDVAARNGAVLVDCGAERGGVVVVRARVVTPWGDALAGARAGPAWVRAGGSGGDDDAGPAAGGP